MKKILFAAMAATMMFASCSENDETLPVNTSEETRVGLKLAFPSSGAARADDGSATAEELVVKSVKVFIFNEDGTKNVFADRDISKDFKAITGEKNAYELITKSKIATTTGVKHVYVGVNLPDAFATNVTKEDDLDTEFATTVAALTSASAGYAMFSTAVQVTPSLVTEDDASWGTTNLVKVDVERLIAKMTANVASDLANDVAEGSFGDLSYQLAQAGKESMFRITQRDGNGKLVTNIAHSGYPALSTFKALNVPTLALNAAARTSIFGLEHAGLNLQRQEVTYAVFTAKFTPEFVTEKAGEEYKTETAWSGGDDFYVIETAAGRFFFADETAAEEYAADNETAAPVFYKGGNCYYPVYLGAGTTYEFARNQYYNLTVTKFTGLGEPGDENGEPTVPENPTKPVVELSTELMVNINIVPWNVIVIPDVELE
ncbi:Mfa1 family fimbria major subunit [Bacteroides sp. 519]|uniref:Mfa1 family fimbria major subunit n=1 Tax=Bacteroides sp. 519 TaxID=2302937 RepID=UPI0013D41E18|nr:Mfa1 family fimbria major subunit [Bacteroides sp. 519]